MKILVTIHIPAINEMCDVWVPDSLRIKTVASMLAEAVEELSDHRYVVSGEEVLCSKEKNILLRANATLEKYGIRNGDHLIMT